MLLVLLPFITKIFNNFIQDLRMSSSLNQYSVMLRDAPMLCFFKFEHVPCCFKDSKILIDCSETVLPVGTFTIMINKVAKTPFFWCKNYTFRRFESVRTLSGGAGKSSDSLKKPIPWAEVSDQNVSIDIKALFNSLRGDHYHSPAIRMFA